MDICIYCQANPATERDHVTLRGLFPEPRPPNLITVPACKPCNSGFGPDDEYFLRLALEWGASESDDGKIVAENRLRSMKRKESRNFWKPFFTSLQPVEVISPGGVYLANSLEFRLDTSRIQRTVNRMIRGLYYHETGALLPTGDFVRSLPYSQFFESFDSESKTGLLTALASLPSRFIGDAFGYRYTLLEGAQYHSMWNLLFFRRIEFVGVTGDPKNSIVTGNHPHGL